METRANYALIGAFTVLSLIMAAIFTVWIANTGFDQKYAEYDVKFRGPVRGLEIGGEVRFNGIKVGEVTKLGLDKIDPKDVVARIRIDDTTPIKTDSLAQLEPSGLTGLSYIQIMAGGEKSPPLTRLRGQERPMILSQRGQLDRFLEGGEGVLDSTLETVARLNRLLNDRNLKNFEATLKNLESASGQIANNGQLLDSANNAAKSVDKAGQQIQTLAKSLDSVPKMANTYDQLGQSLIVHTNEIGTKTNTFLDSGDKLARDLSDLSKKTGNTMGEIDATARSLRASTNNLDSAIKNIDRASVNVDKFFVQGTYQTLPDFAAAAQQVKSAAETIDRTVQDASNSPSGLLSKAPNKTVKWKK